MHVSLHPVHKERLALLFFVEAPDSTLEALVRNFAHVLPAEGCATTTRNLKGHVLHEFHWAEHKPPLEGERFSYFLADGYLIGSFSPFLVEEVVRTLGGQPSLFHARPQGRAWLEGTGARERVYLTARGLSRFLGTFFPAFQGEPAAFRSALSMEIFTHLAAENEGLYLGGELPVTPTIPRDVLTSGVANASAKEQKTSAFWHVVPEDCMGLWTYSFADASRWNTHMLPYWRKHEAVLLEERVQEFAVCQLDVSAFFRSIGSRTGVMYLESSAYERPNRVFFLEVDKREAIAQRLLAASKNKEKERSSFLVEAYRGHAIQYFPLRNFPYLLFGRGFGGFSELYYTFVDRFLVASSSLATLKGLLDSLQADATWKMSGTKHSFLDNSVPGTRVGAYVNWRRYWKTLGNSLSAPFWRSYFAATTWEQAADAMMAFEVAYRADRFYVYAASQVPSVGLPSAADALTRPLVFDDGTYPSDAQGESTALAEEVAAVPVNKEPTIASAQKVPQIPSAVSRYQKRVAHTFGKRIIAKPQFVYLREADDYLVFLQDEALFLHAIFKSELRWTLPLKEPVISPVYAIDYHGNNQRQYLFATPSQWHALQAGGGYLTPFPLNMPVTNIQHFSLVDYDKSKKYRFLLATADGKLFITNKKGVPLEGWRPKRLAAPLTYPPFHVRLPGRDALIGVQQTGTLEVFRRRGTPFPSFPISFNEPISSPVFVSKKDTWQDSQLTCITAGGTMTVLNFSGKVLQKKQLPAALDGGVFGLVKETIGRGYVAYQHNKGAVSLFSSAGMPLFQKNFSFTQAPDFQFYNFGKGKKIIILHDSENKKTYFYSPRGEEALPSPIDSTHKVGLAYNANAAEYVVYGVHGGDYFVLSHPAGVD